MKLKVFLEAGIKSGSSVFALVNLGWKEANILVVGMARPQDREKTLEEALNIEADRRPEINDMMLSKLNRANVCKRNICW